MVINKKEKALSIYLVIFFLSIVILSTAQFLKSKTVQRVERAMKNNDSSNLNYKGIKEVNKVKKSKESFIWTWGSIALIAFFAILTAWYSNTDIEKSPLTIFIFYVVGLVGSLLAVVYYYTSLIPFFKRYINKKIKNK